MAEAADSLKIGVGGNWGRLSKVKDIIRRVRIGSSTSRPATQADTQLIGQPMVGEHEMRRIQFKVIPQLRSDLENLYHTVDMKYVQGSDYSVDLDPYIDFVYASLTADHQEPKIGVESITTSSNGHREFKIKARHRESMIENEYYVNPRLDENDRSVERLLKGYLRKHIQLWNDLLSHGQFQFTKDDIRKQLFEQIWVNAQSAHRGNR